MDDEKRGRAAAALSAAMNATLQEPPIPVDWDQPLAEWRSTYRPERAHEYAGELAGLVRELDEGFPGWRVRQKFDGFQVGKIAWIKVRIQRVRQIVTGKGAWGIREQWQEREEDIDGHPIGGKVFAIPVRPSSNRTDAYDPIVSAVAVARETGRPVAEVRAALAALPRRVRDARAWVSQWSPPEGPGLAPQPDAVPPATASGGAP